MYGCNGFHPLRENKGGAPIGMYEAKQRIFTLLGHGSIDNVNTLTIGHCRGIRTHRKLEILISTHAHCVCVCVC